MDTKSAHAKISSKNSVKVLHAWQFLTIADLNIEAFCKQYGAAFKRVTDDAFNNIASLDEEKLILALRESTHVGLLEQDRQLEGFSLLVVDPRRRLRGKLLMWINKIAISVSAQGKGNGISRLIIDVAQIIDNEQLGFVGCCTQSTSLINKLSGLGLRSYGLFDDYGTPEGVGIWTYLTLNIEQLRTRFNERLNELDHLLFSNYGILKNGYPHSINVSRQHLRPDILVRLNERNFKQDEGDMLVLLAELGK